MAINYRILGRTIRQLRTTQGITQQQLAEMIDKSTAFVSLLERGEKGLSLETLVLIAEALKTSPDRLLQGNYSLDPIMKGMNIVDEFSEYERFILLETRNALCQILKEAEKLKRGGKP